MSDITKWPEEIQIRTTEEWTALGANWQDPDSRAAIVAALKALKIPATEYARKQPPERVELIIKLQEQLVPGSTKGGAAEKPAAAGKAAAPKAGGKAAAPKAGATGGGTVSVDLSEVNAKLDQLQATSTNIETLLKLLLLNPANADSLTLAVDPDVLAEFREKSIEELAGNG